MRTRFVRTKKRKAFLGVVGVVLAVVLGVMVASAVGTEIDMTVANNEVAFNDAIFIQGPIDINSAGTGVIDPFLSVRGSGSPPIIDSGYNTVDASAEFDTVTGGDRTRPLLLSGVPEVEINGSSYREFKLDINKAVGGSPYLALSELQLWLTDDPAITGYDPTTKTWPGADGILGNGDDPNASLEWDLGDAVVLMDYSLESGSGQSDVSFFVLSSVLNTAEDCSYGSSACTTYLVMWNEYGDYIESGADEDKWTNNDGFEEWGIVLRPVVDAEKTAEGTYDRTIDWDITKSVDPAQHDMFIGDSDTSEYTIELTKNVTEGNFAASGTITIYNPTGCGDATCPVPEDVPAEILSVEDVIDQAGLETVASVDCGVTFPYTLGSEETLVCSYTATPTNADAGVNTAAITVEVPEQIGGGTDTYEAFADLTFALGDTFGDEAVNVDDTNDDGDASAIGDSTTYSYDGEFACSSDPADYTNGFYSYDHDNTATIVETGESDDATVTVNCYAPVLAKDASASYDERHDWNIIKTVDPESQGAFAGDLVNWTWTIEIEETVVDENFAVTGDIDVTNPAGSPGDMTVDLADVLNDGTTATVDCGSDATSVTVAPGATETCAYSASPADASATLNTATGTFNSIDFIATAGVSFSSNVVNDSATFSDPDLEIGDMAVNGPSTTDYPDEATCSDNPADYADGGSYMVSVDNTGYLVDEEGNEYSDDATTTYTCYAPVLDKDASASYDERHDWNIIKTVDPESQGAFAGDPVNWTWTIEIEEFVNDENFAVTGDINVTNPAGSPGNMTVDLADALNDGTTATVDCGSGATSVTVAPGATETCAYSASPADASATLNTATGTFNSIDFIATAGVSFITNVVNDSATFSDPTLEIGDTVVTDPSTMNYPDGDVCSGDEADYGDDGMYTISVSNTGYLVDEEGTQYSDDATTTYTCYAPVLDKDASAGYDERHTWDIDKVVDPTSQSGYPGDELSWEWKVTLSESSVDENFAVSGSINVSNPAGSPGDMTVDVSDALSDGTVATVDCGGGAMSVTVAPGATETCAYSASPADASATLNTATGTFNGNDFTATADVTFIANVINGTADVDDDQEPDFPVTVNAGEGPWEWTETQSHICASDWAAYGAGGTYSDTRYNTATVTGSNGQTDSANAETTYTCEAGTIDVQKYTDGVVNGAYEWQFALFVGPDGFGGTQVGNTSSTSGDADGILDFGDPIPALRPDTTYTVCELNVPAAWATSWSIDGATVIPYNPNSDDSPPEDLGNRCFDVGAGTSYPVSVGQNLRITVDNTFPGGEARTPGYWKNWSSCSNGGQYAKTTDDVDPNNEYVSLDEVLNDPGISWGEFTIDSCELAVSILDQRDFDKGKKMASDAAYTLAMHLLAAQLNFGAGAETCTAAQDAVLAGETLLVSIGFDGTGSYLRPKADLYDDALGLAATLDAYNNGNLCSP